MLASPLLVRTVITEYYLLSVLAFGTVMAVVLLLTRGRLGDSTTLYQSSVDRNTWSKHALVRCAPKRQPR